MPVYCFKCPRCGHRQEFLRPMERRNDPVDCLCSQRMARDLAAERLGSTDLPYDKPVYSDAMGCHADQVAAFRKAHPNIEITDQGRVVCRSHREHRRVMRELGFFDRRGFN